MVGAPRRQKKSRQNADKSNSGAFILPSSDLVSKQLNSGAGKARAFISRALRDARNNSAAPLASAPLQRAAKSKFAFSFLIQKMGGGKKEKSKGEILIFAGSLQKFL